MAQLLTARPPRAQLRYANNSNYKNDTIIRKEVYVSPAVLAEVKRIVQESEARACAATPRPALRRRSRCAALCVRRVNERRPRALRVALTLPADAAPARAQVLKEDDSQWPEPDRIGRQELEVVMGEDHVSFAAAKIGSLLDVQSSKDPEGLRVFYYVIQARARAASPRPHARLRPQTLQRRNPRPCRAAVRLIWLTLAAVRRGAQDLKCLVLSLISLHFKIKPI